MTEGRSCRGVEFSNRVAENVPWSRARGDEPTTIVPAKVSEERGRSSDDTHLAAVTRNDDDPGFASVAERVPRES